MKYLQMKKDIKDLERKIKTGLYWACKSRNYPDRIRIKLGLSNDWLTVYNNLCGYRNLFELKEKDPLWTKMRELQKEVGMMR